MLALIENYRPQNLLRRHCEHTQHNLLSDLDAISEDLKHVSPELHYARQSDLVINSHVGPVTWLHGSLPFLLETFSVRHVRCYYDLPLHLLEMVV